MVIAILSVSQQSRASTFKCAYMREVLVANTTPAQGHVKGHCAMTYTKCHSSVAVCACYKLCCAENGNYFHASGRPLQADSAAGFH